MGSYVLSCLLILRYISCFVLRFFFFFSCFFDLCAYRLKFRRPCVAAMKYLQHLCEVDAVLKKVFAVCIFTAFDMIVGIFIVC